MKEEIKLVFPTEEYKEQMEEYLQEHINNGEYDKEYNRRQTHGDKPFIALDVLPERRLMRFGKSLLLFPYCFFRFHSTFTSVIFWDFPVF